MLSQRQNRQHQLPTDNKQKQQTQVNCMPIASQFVDVDQEYIYVHTKNCLILCLISYSNFHLKLLSSKQSAISKLL